MKKIIITCCCLIILCSISSAVCVLWISKVAPKSSLVEGASVLTNQPKSLKLRKSKSCLVISILISIEQNRYDTFTRTYDECRQLFQIGFFSHVYGTKTQTLYFLRDDANLCKDLEGVPSVSGNDSILRNIDLDHKSSSKSLSYRWCIVLSRYSISITDLKGLLIWVIFEICDIDNKHVMYSTGFALF